MAKEMSEKTRAMVALMICKDLPKYFQAIMQILLAGKYFQDRFLIPNADAVKAISHISGKALVPFLREVRAMLDIPVVVEFLKLPEEGSIEQQERRLRLARIFGRVGEEISCGEEKSTARGDDGWMICPLARECKGSPCKLRSPQKGTFKELEEMKGMGRRCPAPVRAMICRDAISCRRECVRGNINIPHPEGPHCSATMETMLKDGDFFCPGCVPYEEG